MPKPVASGSPVSSKGRKKKKRKYLRQPPLGWKYFFEVPGKPKASWHPGIVLYQGSTRFDFAFRWKHNISKLHSQGSSPSYPWYTSELLHEGREQATAASWLPEAAQLREHGILFPAPGHSGLQMEAASGFQTREKLKIRKGDKDWNLNLKYNFKGHNS